MERKKMKRKTVKLLTGLTAACLTIAQPTTVLAAEDDALQTETVSESTSTDGNGGESGQEASSGSSAEESEESTSDAAPAEAAAEGSAVEESAAAGTASEQGSEAELREGAAEAAANEETATDETVTGDAQGTGTTEETGDASTAAAGETAAGEASGETTAVTPAAEEDSADSAQTEQGKEEEQTPDGTGAAAGASAQPLSSVEAAEKAQEASENAPAENTETTGQAGAAKEEAPAGSALPAVSAAAVPAKESDASAQEEVKTEDTAASITRDGTTKTYRTLQAAIDEAEENDEIRLAKDVTENVVISDKKNVVVNLCGKVITAAKEAADGVKDACIQILESTGITIRGNDENGEKQGTITGAEASGIRISQSSVDLVNLLLTGNKGVLGGGVYAENDSTVRVTGGSFTGNEATGSSNPLADGVFVQTSAGGGAIYAIQSNVTVNGTSFKENKAGNAMGAGGAISTTLGNLTVDKAEFKGNTAGGEGGAVATRGTAKVTITNSTFTGNSAKNGGAVNTGNFNNAEKGKPEKNTTEEVTLENVTVSGNTASGLGGGIYTGTRDKVTVRNSLVTANKAENGTDSQGGGIVAYGSELTLNGASITNNEAAVGGGIFMLGIPNGKLVLENGTMISGNKATASYGGGIYAYNTTVQISDAEISGNKAQGAGGGMFTYLSKVSVQNSKVVGNSSENSGGGVYSHTDSSFAMEGTDVQKNQAVIYGGGVMVQNPAGKAVIKNSSITGNRGAYGAGVAVYGSGAAVNAEGEQKAGNLLELIADLLTGNEASVYGGGIYLGNAARARVTAGVTLCNNTAKSAGDDLYAWGLGTELWLPAVGKDWKLDACGHAITGWYADAKGERWDADALRQYVIEFLLGKAGETLDTDAYIVKFETVNGNLYAHVTMKKGGSLALKAAHGTPKPAPTPEPAPSSNTTSTSSGTTEMPAAEPLAAVLQKTPPEAPAEVIEASAPVISVVTGTLRGRGTGDETRMAVWGSVALASLAGIGLFVGVLLKKRRS